MAKEIIKEFVEFLKNDKVNLQRHSCSNLLNLTGTKDGINLILNEKELLLSAIKLINHSDVEIAKNAFKTLINISCEEIGTTTLVALEDVDFIAILIQCIQNPLYQHADFSCAVLNNVTRYASNCPKVLECINNLPVRLEGLISILCDMNYNKREATLNHLALVISNFTQTKEGRREILNKEKNHFERLLCFIDAPGSKVRRKAVIYAIHNCTFEKDYHEWFLSDKINLSTRLVLPLAGPDVFSIEENESLHIDLQFLPDDKVREEDKDLRALLLESLMQLCTIRKCREQLREQNVYLILREHHLWETEKRCILINEDIVNLLFKTEEEIGEDDLSAMEVPADMVQKFTEFDGETLEEDEKK